MNKIFKIAAATALIAVSASASAWWGNPVSTFADEFFGDGAANGDFNFNMNANADTRAYGRGYHNYYGAPYGHGPYGYAPYGYAPVPPMAPVAPIAQAPQAPEAK